MIQCQQRISEMRTSPFSPFWRDHHTILQLAWCQMIRESVIDDHFCWPIELIVSVSFSISYNWTVDCILHPLHNIMIPTVSNIHCLIVVDEDFIGIAQINRNYCHTDDLRIYCGCILFSSLVDIFIFGRNNCMVLKIKYFVGENDNKKLFWSLWIFSIKHLEKCFVHLNGICSFCDRRSFLIQYTSIELIGITLCKRICSIKWSNYRDIFQTNRIWSEKFSS